MNRSIKFSLNLACLLLVLAFTVAPRRSQTVNGVSDDERNLGMKLYQEGRYSEGLAALKKAVKPPTLNGQPVSMFMQLEYNFNLYEGVDSPQSIL